MTLYNRSSALYTSKAFAKYAEEAAAWQLWHSSRIYSRPVSAGLREDMAIPNVIAGVEDVDICRTREENRVGIIIFGQIAFRRTH